MIRQIVLAALITGALISALGFFKYRQVQSAIAANANMGIPPVAVTTFTAAEQQWNRSYSAIGTLNAVQGAMLSAEATGRVSAIHFESGNSVAKDQILVELDIGAEAAELQGAEALHQFAEQRVKRQRDLRPSNAISQASLDDAEAALRAAQAKVDNLKAIIKRKRIIAPFAGNAGIRQVNVGQTINIGDAVVAVHSFDPLYVDFSLPQQAIGDLYQGQQLQVSVDSYPDRSFNANLSAIESSVDPDTRNVSLRAILENPKQLLMPGMFVKVRLLLKDKDTVVAIPSSGIQYAPYGNSIFVVLNSEKQQNNPSRPVESRTIKLGRRIGDMVSVVSGVKPGEEVVSSGTFKVNPGARVIVNNSAVPGSELQPNPTDS